MLFNSLFVNNKKNIFVAIILFAAFFFSADTVFSAGTKKMGESCTMNGQCASDDCEDSTLEGQEGDDYCDCDDANDCTAQYGPGNWTCENGTAQSYTLDFCKNGTTIHYPVGSTENPAKKKKIGEICGTDAECASNDCENSAVKNGKGQTIAYCDCDDDNDCSVQYGKDSSWSCVDGNQKSQDLDFCTAFGKTEYPIAPADAKEGPGVINTLINPESAIDQRELQDLIAAPQPRIKIPGVQFTDIETVKKNTVEGDGPAGPGTYLNIPYFGEYLAAIYRFAVVAASVIAIVIIIIQGFVITASGGNSERMSHAKERIGQAVTGLIIAVASYVILFTINPELVQFRNLKVLYVQKEPYEGPDDGEVAPDGSNIPRTKICNTYQTCKPFCLGNQPNLEKIKVAAAEKGITMPTGVTEISPLLREKFKAAGCAPTGSPDSQSEFVNCGLHWHNGKSGRYALPSMADGLVKAALKAKSQGYGISIGSMIRPLETQVQKVCGWIERNPEGPVKVCQNAADNSPKPKDAKGSIIKDKDTGLACPGATNHFGGFAADLNLFSLSDKKFTPLTPQTGGAKACSDNAQIEKGNPNLLKLNEIMFSTGWWKFCQEQWHFEYVSTPGPMRKNKTEWP